MGTEISVEGRTVVAQSDDETRNVRHPLRFHQVHGDNVKLERNRTVASRPEGFCKGIAFSHRPIKVREPIYIKFIEISSNWSGALRIGFTMNDPMTMKSKLPLYACPNLTVLEGNWVKAIAERMAKKDSILFYYVEKNGDVHYGIDSITHGVFFSGVNTSGKLWAVLDIYGNTISVEFVNPDPMPPENPPLNNATTLVQRRESNISQIMLSPELNENLYWEPRVRGRNVRLEGNHHAYRKIGYKDQAYVFLNQSLRLGWRMALEVVQTSNECKGSLVYGITSCNPTTLNPAELPKDPDDLMDRLEYWIVKYDSNSYQEGDIIIYSIDTQGEVTVTRNTDKFAAFHVDPTQPIWLFFNVSGLVSGLGIVGAMSSDGVSDVTGQLENLKVSLPEKDVMKSSLPGPSSKQEGSECVICCEESNCALYRCGHMCMCYKCAMKMWQPGSKALCPLCRKEIIDVIKIYK